MGKGKQSVKVYFKKGQQHLELLAKHFVFRGMEKKGVKNSGTGFRRPIKRDS